MNDLIPMVFAFISSLQLKLITLNEGSKKEIR